MPQGHLNPVVRHLRRLATTPVAATESDARLLEQFVTTGDEAAFTTLARRHGCLVRAVCRHILHQEEDIEDALQATFLVLARKAATIRNRSSVASWLYGVAYRTAMNAKKTATRRRSYEKKAVSRSPEQPVSEAALRELQALLDEEVQRLPEKYRAPFVLCCLQGKTKAEAAQELRWKEGTVSGRLVQARKQLRVRLARRGVTLSAALCVTALSKEATDAPAAIVHGVLLFTAGQPGAIRASAAALAEGVLKSMCLTKLKLAAALALTLGLASAGAGLLAYQQRLAHQPDRRQTEQPRPAAQDADVRPRPEPKPGRTDRYGDFLPDGATQRLGTLRFRPGGGNIDSLLVSADGKTLISKTFYGDRTVCAWELATGKLLHQFPGHYDENHAVAISPDGKTLAVGHDKLIRFWDMASGRELRQLKAPLPEVQGLAFSPDGKTLASGHGSEKVILWDLATAKSVAQLSAKHRRLMLLAFTPDGKTLVTGDTLDPTVRLFDLATRQERHRLSRPDFIRALALSPDGSLLALAGRGGTPSLWEVSTGKLVRELRQGSLVLGVAFSPDGKILASVEYDEKTRQNAIVLWDLGTGKERGRLQKQVGPVWSVAFSADGRTVIASSLGAIRLWDVTTGEECGPAAGNPGYVGSVILSPDGQTLAYQADSSIRLWDLASAREAGRLAGDHWSSAFSPDSKTLAGGIDVNQVNLWDVAGGRLVRRLKCDPKKDGFDRVYYYQVAFSPDGQLLASAGRALLPSRRGTDAVVQLWDLATGKGLRRLSMKDRADEFCDAEGAVAFSPDGKTVAASGQGAHDGRKVRAWEVATGKQLARLSAALNEPLDQGPRNASVQERSILPRITFSPDGKMLAVNRSQKTIVVWEAATGKERLRLDGHQDSTSCVVFSPDCRTLASASWDNTIRLWDLATGKELRRLTGHRGKAHSLAFSADGKALVSAGDDTTILFWDVTTVTQRSPQPIDQLAPKEWYSLWLELAGADASKAYKAMQRLIAAPQFTLACLKRHLRPAAAIDRLRLSQLITDLDSNQFAVRRKASLDLEMLGGTIQPDLQQALASSPPLELRRRLEGLLVKLELPSGEHLRDLRAVEVLEHIGTSEAQQILRELADGASEARLTQEARVCMQRLARRPSANP
jgi:RNA polymerase sigma factor (sigma-70 family)